LNRGNIIIQLTMPWRQKDWRREKGHKSEADLPRREYCLERANFGYRFDPNRQ